jgi:hypothetical protein
VPDEESELGQKVAALHNELDAIEMDIITYGIFFIPNHFTLAIGEQWFPTL